MALTPKQRAEQRASLLAALDAADDLLAEALEAEANQPHLPPFNYDARNRLPRTRRP